MTKVLQLSTLPVIYILKVDVCNCIYAACSSCSRTVSSSFCQHCPKASATAKYRMKIEFYNEGFLFDGMAFDDVVCDMIGCSASILQEVKHNIKIKNWLKLTKSKLETENGARINE